MPAVNELEFNPRVKVERPEQGYLVRFCQKRGIAVIGYNSLGGTKAKRGVIESIAQKHNATATQLLLRYSLDHDIAVVPTSGSESHIQENLQLGHFR